MSTDKHAYLILAHKNDLVFRTLISLLDDSRNDIYIHMDIKCKDYSQKEIEDGILYSSVYHIKRTSCSWGGYSLIRTTVRLLEKATESGIYQYYHLLSGEDLPIKSQNVIHKFFDDNCGKEFVQCDDGFNCLDRINQYYLFQEKFGRNQNKWRVIDYKLRSVQRKLGIFRNSGIDFAKGSQWFSITDEFARFVISKKRWIRKVFKYSHCCDEVFIHTILVNSKFVNALYYSAENYKDSERLIDWKRGTPYTFTLTDYDELILSGSMFARKFSESIDSNIVRKLYIHIKDKVD